MAIVCWGLLPGRPERPFRRRQQQRPRRRCGPLEVLMASIAESIHSRQASTSAIPFSLTIPEQIGEAISDFGFQLIKPMHYSSEQILRCFTPIHPGEFGNHDSKLVEIIVRVCVFALCSLLSPLTLALWSLGGLLDFVGTCLKSTPFTYLQGGGQEKIDGRSFYQFFSLNACLFWGGLPIPFGGVVPARGRIEQIGNLIRAEDADFVILQEVSYGPALALWERIKDKYAHGFTRIAPSPWTMMETSLFVASKYPIIGQPQFLPLPTNSSFKRGLFCFETKDCWICTTHLESGDGEASIRMRARQMDLIVTKINELKKEKPYVFLGDLNIARIRVNDEEYALIQNQFHDPYGDRPFSKETATCTNLLIDHNWGKRSSSDADFELLDYVLVDKKFPTCVKKIDLVPTFDLSTSATIAKAPTDHRGLRTQISFS